MELKPRKWKNEAKKKLNEYKRVLQIATKPDREEFSMAAKVTGAGIVIIGVMGFVFYLASNLIPQYI
ncbi:MAG: protein translocase SEC61 complex subunit gamma [Candidatus Nanohaloarchaea archaeon]